MGRGEDEKRHDKLGSYEVIGFRKVSFTFCTGDLTCGCAIAQLFIVQSVGLAII